MIQYIRSTLHSTTCVFLGITMENKPFNLCSYQFVFQEYLYITKICSYVLVQYNFLYLYTYIRTSYAHTSFREFNQALM